MENWGLIQKEGEAGGREGGSEGGGDRVPLVVRDSQ